MPASALSLWFPCSTGSLFERKRTSLHLARLKVQISNKSQWGNFTALHGHTINFLIVGAYCKEEHIHSEGGNRLPPKVPFNWWNTDWASLHRQVQAINLHSTVSLTINMRPYRRRPADCAARRRSSAAHPDAPLTGGCTSWSGGAPSPAPAQRTHTAPSR